jgi:hypothetical protein
MYYMTVVARCITAHHTGLALEPFHPGLGPEEPLEIIHHRRYHE